MEKEEKGQGLLIGMLPYISALFAALTWAASASQFINLLDFIERLLHGWRDFFRGLWQRFFDWVEFPYDITPEQTDVLTLSGFVFLISLQPVLFGLKGKKVFHDWPRTTDHYAIEDLFRFLFLMLIMLSLVAPFMPLLYFSGEIGVFYVFFFGFVFITLPIPVWSAILRWDFTSLKNLASRFFKGTLRSWVGRIFFFPTALIMIPTFFMIGVIGPFVILFFIYRWITLNSFVDAVISILPHYEIDSGIMLHEAARQYVDGFQAENIISFIVLALLAGALIAAFRKSFLPAVRIVFLGLIILGIGSGAEPIAEIWAETIG